MAFGDGGKGLGGKQLTMSQLASLAKSAAAKVDPACDKRIRALAQIGVGLMKKEIQTLHAVDTGTMLNSTVADSAGKNTVLIGPTVDYAAYVALGTSRVAARPFHINASHELGIQAREDFDLDLGI